MTDPRHPLLKSALPTPRGTPLATWQDDFSTIPKDGHADFAALMHSARHDAGRLLRRQLEILWPAASAQDLALAEGLGVALWLTEMLLFVRKDTRILLPHDLMQQYMVDAQQIQAGRHDFALRRLSQHLASRTQKILQGSAALGLSAPLRLRYRLRWSMLHAGWILHAMQHDPQAPFINPQLSLRDRLHLVRQTLWPSRKSMRSGSCGSSGCAT